MQRYELNLKTEQLTRKNIHYYKSLIRFSLFIRIYASLHMAPTPSYSKFTSEFKVRPDDIDMFNHVHNSKYFDYVLAARYDQMERFYGVPMEDFLSHGYGWVVKTAFVDYKRALGLGEEFSVTTGIETINPKGCRVLFSIKSKKTGKLCCDGWFDYVMIDMSTGRGAKVSEDIIRKYSI